MRRTHRHGDCQPHDERGNLSPATSGQRVHPGGGTPRQRQDGDVVEGNTLERFLPHRLPATPRWHPDRRGGHEYAIGTNGDGTNDAAEANVISANGGTGITMGVSGTNDTLIRGNFIGTNAAGTAALANGGDGISMYDWNYGGPSQGSAQRTTVRDNTISGNTWYGIEIAGAGNKDHVIAGNRIGTNATGTAALGNALGGVRIAGAAINITIGGSATADRNLLSGNAGSGVTVADIGTTGNVIAGNYIGTNAAGIGALSNTGDGINVSGGASGNTIGGNTTGTGNLISGNTLHGVRITGTGTNSNVIVGNFIGTNAAGTAAVPNSTGGVITDGAIHVDTAQLTASARTATASETH